MGILTRFIATALFFSFVATGFNLFYINFASNYGISIDENLDSFNKTDQLYNETDKLIAKVKSEDTTLSAFQLIVTGPIIAVKNFLNSLSVFKDMTSLVSKFLVLPDFTTRFVNALVITVIGIGVLGLLLGRDA